ncbi:hypothetical protein FGO68_gene15549 [Halteria grandinella]|uniref:Uncharacterized protein n=1 Tax=Halteria grandinella TaxID=5974 RepID=A0A8J8T2R8_HALGN|nr:hypothetical protein FGO68_gene15549 [Halteria grandinella]
MADPRISQLISFSLSEATRIYSYHREFLFAQETSFATQEEIEGLYQKLLPELHQELVAQRSALIELDELIQSLESNVKPFATYSTTLYKSKRQLAAIKELLQSGESLCIPIQESPAFKKVQEIRTQIIKQANSLTKADANEFVALSQPPQRYLSIMTLIVICFESGQQWTKCTDKTKT